MPGSLSYPNKVKDAYTKLVFWDDNAEKLYRDNGTKDVLVAAGGHEGIDNDLDYLKFTATETLSSGNILTLINNSETQFSVTWDGVVLFKDHDSVPVAVEGGLYYSNGELYIGT